MKRSAKSNNDAADEFDVSAKTAPTPQSEPPAQSNEAQPAATIFTTQRTPLPKPGPPPPDVDRIEKSNKAGGIDPTRDDKGRKIVADAEFVASLPNELGPLLQPLTKLDNEDFIVGNARAESKRRANLEAVRLKVRQLQQGPEAPVAIAQNGPSNERVSTLKQKLRNYWKP